MASSFRQLWKATCHSVHPPFQRGNLLLPRGNHLLPSRLSPPRASVSSMSTVSCTMLRRDGVQDPNCRRGKHIRLLIIPSSSSSSSSSSPLSSSSSSLSSSSSSSSTGRSTPSQVEYLAVPPRSAAGLLTCGVCRSCSIFLKGTSVDNLPVLNVLKKKSTFSTEDPTGIKRTAELRAMGGYEQRVIFRKRSRSRLVPRRSGNEGEEEAQVGKEEDVANLGSLWDGGDQESSIASDPSAGGRRKGTEQEEDEESAALRTGKKKKQKRRVAIWLGYVGTGFRGLQVQSENRAESTVEGVLEKAILASGGMLESNYGNMYKLGWNRSSRTDKGVHSLATVVSMKMEVSDDMWTAEDPNGLQAAKAINALLPPTVRAFGIVPVQKSFSARHACRTRTYEYLLPAELLGIQSNLKNDPLFIKEQLEKFQMILGKFEGYHPFHNYTKRKLYRPTSPGLKQNQLDQEGYGDGEVQRSDAVDGEGGSGSMKGAIVVGDYRPEREDVDDSDGEEDVCMPNADGTDFTLSAREEQERSGSNNGSTMSDSIGVKPLGSIGTTTSGLTAYWLSKKDPNDAIGRSHYRRILSCTCGNIEREMCGDGEVSFVRVLLKGESFMFNQIRKMVGTAVAVLRGRLSLDLMEASLCKHARVVLPIAPSEGLLVADCEFLPFRRNVRSLSLKNVGQQVRGDDSYSISDPQQWKEKPDQKEDRLVMSDAIQKERDAFWRGVLLPSILPLLVYKEGGKVLWTEWEQWLQDEYAVPVDEAEAILKAYQAWREVGPPPRRQMRAALGADSEQSAVLSVQENKQQQRRGSEQSQLSTVYD